MSRRTQQRRILDGVRVVDITQLVAGPYCTRMLADLGADVIRIDPPARGLAASAPRRSAGPASLNLGKRSIVLDLKHPDGLEAVQTLINRADIVVENYLPGVVARLGLGYGELSRANRGLIYASISGFGQDTSYSHRRAYGATAQAEAGWIWVQQKAQGGPEPFAPGVTVADLVTGMNAFSAILAALYDRERSGQGQRIDIALMDSQLAMLTEVAGEPLRGQAEDEWQPFRHGLQQAKDGHLAVNIGPPRNWLRIAKAFGYSGAPAPGSQEEASRLLAGWIGERTTADAARALEDAGAPYGVVKSMREAVEHPYFAERGMVSEVEDPLDRNSRFIGSPLFFSNAESAPLGGAPLAGQHTQLVLRELGYDEPGIAALIAAGAAEHQATP